MTNNSQQIQRRGNPMHRLFDLIREMRISYYRWRLCRSHTIPGQRKWAKRMAMAIKARSPQQVARMESAWRVR